jgi:hypothetical protein
MKPHNGYKLRNSDTEWDIQMTLSERGTNLKRQANISTSWEKESKEENKLENE